MVNYDSFARFYDAVNGEPEDRISEILHHIALRRPHATSVLELGCGTGAILAGLGSGFALTGIDISPEMLSFARRRCPSARFVHGDITAFDLGVTFDVVVCVFDTLNHITTWEGWMSVFENAWRHLEPGGLFIFDLNTLGHLRELGEMTPWVHDFDGHTLIMDVDFTGNPIARWDIRIFERQSGGTYRLHHEVIDELGVPLARVREALTAVFDVRVQSDADGSPATDDSERAIFVAQRR